MEQEELIKLLQKPSRLTGPQTAALKEVLEQHPYFQAGRSLWLKGLKNEGSLHYNRELKLTAAHTLDRSVLFDYITSEEFNQNRISSEIKRNQKQEEESSAPPSGKTPAVTLDEALRMKLKESEQVFDPELFSKMPPPEEQDTAEEPEAPSGSDEAAASEKAAETRKGSGAEEAASKVPEASEPSKSSRDIRSSPPAPENASEKEDSPEPKEAKAESTDRHRKKIEEKTEEIKIPGDTGKSTSAEKEETREETSEEGLSPEGIGARQNTQPDFKTASISGDGKPSEEPEKENMSTADPAETLHLGKPLAFQKNESHSFSEWLQLTTAKPLDRSEEEGKPAEGKMRKLELIDEFILKSPKIKPGKNVIKTNLAEQQQTAPEALMTETLARVYLEQKNYKKAIQAYKILILKNPEKSGFFADQIRAIKKLQENNS